MNENTRDQQLEPDFFIPEELNSDLEDYPMPFTDISSMFDRVIQLTNGYPSLKEFMIEKIAENLDVEHHLDTARSSIKIFEISTPFVNVIDISDIKITYNENQSIDAVSFFLNCLSPFFCRHILGLLGENLIGAYTKDENGKDIYHEWFPRLFQKMNFFTIRNAYKVKLNNFWQKNLNNYRILAKYSFLNALLQQQKIGKNVLSAQALKMIGQAIELDMKNFDRIQSSIVMSPSIPRDIRVSAFTLNNQVSSDILLIQEVQNGRIVLYIPQHDPSFIEFENREKMLDWIILQSENPYIFISLKKHFSLFSQLKGPLRRDLQGISRKDLLIEEDIFTVMALNQQARSKDDLHDSGSMFEDYLDVFDYLSTQTSIFTTINLALGSILECLPDVTSMSNFLEQAFPNPYQTASQILQKGIQQKLGLDIDPSKTFISFSLYKRDYPPELILLDDVTIFYQETLSLLGAALGKHLSRYLSCTTGILIYTDPTGEGLYTVGSELDVSFKKLQEAIEEINLETNYNTQYLDLLKTFWKEHGNNIKGFVKYRYLLQAINEYSSDPLFKRAFELISAVGINSLIVEENSSYEIFNENISIEKMCIGDYTATDIFLFKDKLQSLLVLYIASDETPFSIFNDENELQDFLTSQSKTENWASQVALHFPVKSRDFVSQKLSEESFFNNPLLIFVKFDNTKTDLFEVLWKNIEYQSYQDVSKLSKNRYSRSIHEDNWVDTLESISSLAGWATLALLLPALIFPVFNFTILSLVIVKTGVDIYRLLPKQPVKARYQIAIDLGLDVVGILLGVFISEQILRAAASSDLSSISLINAKKTAFTSVSTRAMPLRTTRKEVIHTETFFGNETQLDVWKIREQRFVAAQNGTWRAFGYYSINAWFLGDKFLLFSSAMNKADHLIISSHGGYTLASKNIPVPNNTILIAYGPHGWSLRDPGIGNVAKGEIFPYASIANSYPTPLPGSVAESAYRGVLPPDYQGPLPKYLSVLAGITLPNPIAIDHKVLSGSHIPGHIRNYNLRKFQTPGRESYRVIANVVTESRMFGQSPVDVLTVRNRFGILNPDLEDLFQAMETYNIHYNKITLLFCRSDQLKEMISERLVPTFTPVSITT